MEPQLDDSPNSTCELSASPNSIYEMNSNYEMDMSPNPNIICSISSNPDMALPAPKSTTELVAGERDLSHKSIKTDETLVVGTVIRSLALGQESSQVCAPTDERVPSLLLQCQLYALCFLSGVDGVLLGCTFFALRRNLGLTLGDLAVLGVAQSICATVSGPIWAAFADSSFCSRRSILIFGSIGNSVVTLLLGLVTSWIPMLGLRAVNGMFLACLGPIAAGIIADHTSELKRGKIYGRFSMAGQTGALIGTMIATPMSNQPMFGLAGWRAAFILVGLFGMGAGAWVAMSMDLPKAAVTISGSQSSSCLLLKELRRLSRFLSVPTFDVLVLQGLFGSVGLAASGFQTMYFQMVGIDDYVAGTITSAGTIATGLGIWIGGNVGDFFARRYQHHGRIVVAEVSLALAIPMKFVQFWGMEPFHGSVFWYTTLTSLHGIVGYWFAAGTKLPLLSQLVPADERSSVMAWEGTIEGMAGTFLGGPMVAIVARSFFGFDETDLKTGVFSTNAQALGHATAVMICGPALISLVCWAFMHCSYPRDLRRIERMSHVKDTQADPDSSIDGASEII